MPFVADHALSKTFDLERGLELVKDGGGSDGSTFWKITRADGEKIRFETRFERDFALAWRDANPDAVKPSLYVVTATRGRFPDTGRSEADEIIRQALQAFKGTHGWPKEGDVAIFFEDSTGRVVA